MGFADNLKGMVDKGKDLAAENADKIDKVQEAAKKAIPDK